MPILKKKIKELENRTDWLFILSFTSAFFVTIFLNRLYNFGDNTIKIVLINILVFFIASFFIGVLLVMIAFFIFEAIKIYETEGCEAALVFCIFFGGIFLGNLYNLLTTLLIWVIGIIGFYLISKKS
ncbi:hypothetical protein MWH25_08085 [Natroniella acetigena]|uniref:hypothetical protein n=1 Tax=Natroniella acetigena TaxID=52004 RepID=UPI00200B7D0A|nr:hypothetical protein [Natroniella acetigena]MCK8827701.1 hypothetical protein [Natroniella acetigena]